MVRAVPRPKLLKRASWDSIENDTDADLSQHRMLPKAHFRSTINTERLRSDRSKQPFAFLYFQFEAGSVPKRFIAQLEAFIGTRLRATDSFGFLSSDSFAVICPYTKADSVKSLSAEIHAWLISKGCPCVSKVQQYPSSAQDANAEVVESMWDNDSQDDSRGPLSGDPWMVDRVPIYKHLIDTFGGIFCLILFLPVLLFAALAIKATSKGPVLFVQERIGRGGKPFKLYKFRTMIVGAESLRDNLLALNEQDGPAFKMKHDPRVTRFGRFLRRTSLDELPQLFNVIRRDMSLVGPRPLPTCEATQCSDWQQRRHDVLPGITCKWQVSGRSQVTFDEWMRMDLHYVDHQGLWEDITLLGRTVPAVFSCRGAV